MRAPPTGAAPAAPAGPAAPRALACRPARRHAGAHGLDKHRCWGGADCKGGSTRISNSVTEPDVAERIHKFYEEAAIPAESFARAVAFAMSQPEEVDVNEILFRPTRQEL
jgi:hypothetical protein